MARLMSRTNEVVFMPKAIFAGMTRVYQSGDALTSAGNRLVDCAAFRIAAATLYIALDQVMVHGIEHDLRYLGSGCIVEENEFRITL